MNKTLLIARSEFLRRVRTKAFVLGVLLAPLGLAVVLGIPVLLALFSGDDARREIVVLDESGRLFESVAANLPERFTATQDAGPLDSLRARVLDGRTDAALVLPEALLVGEGSATLLGRSGGGISQLDDVRGAVRAAVRDVRLGEMGAPADVRAVVERRVPLRSVTVTEAGDAADGALVASAVGYVSGFLIYMFVLIYGGLVMRGVIEEKQSRIVEVIASSVRPFELMMGKVLGIGAVGLAQILAWTVLGAALLSVLGPLLALAAGPPTAPTPGADPAAVPFQISDVTAQITPGLLVVLLLCFVGGYLFYAALFAAVGSAVENESDAQALSLPVTLPAVIPLLMLMPMLDQPDSTFAVVVSILPPFSTVLLPVRVAVSEVPVWQVALALGLLAVAFAGAIWAASRIYRVGILMTGKKATFADLWRWVRTA